MSTQRNTKGAARLNRLIDFNSYPLNVVLRILLKDRTTGENIIWATDNYAHLGNTYHSAATIRLKDLIKLDQNVIQPRVYKALELQKQRTKVNAEVFTPSWICCLMNNHLDDVWFDRKDVFTKMDGQKWRATNRKIQFPETGSKTWKRYVDSRRIEITCGEAPYLVSRYDTTTGRVLDLTHRIGILDRKLRVISENAATEDEWFDWATRAYQATYGYEYQGDNLLIARINLLMTFCDYMQDKWDRCPSEEELKTIATIISWNIWQMNGLTYKTPYDADADKARLQEIIDDCDITISHCNIIIHADDRDFHEGLPPSWKKRLFTIDEVVELMRTQSEIDLAYMFAEANGLQLVDEDRRDFASEIKKLKLDLAETRDEMQLIREDTVKEQNLIKDSPYCLIKNWRMRRTECFRDIAQKSKGKGIMKFDFCIGNPPYQEEKEGTSDKPIYNTFMDAAFNLADVVELITPGRFLFDAGKTPKDWNKRMLNDPNLVVLKYYSDSRDVFNGVHFAGGVAITCRNLKKQYGAIQTFIPDDNLRGIFHKVCEDACDNGSISSLMILQNRFIMDALFSDHPEYRTYIDSKGEEKERTERRLVSSAISTFAVFHENCQALSDIQILGIENGNCRIRRWVSSKYIEDNGNLNKYKVVVPKSYGTGLVADGNAQIIGLPEILEPNIGYTQSFIGIGQYDTLQEAENVLKYLKSKFCRICLAITKVTQDNPPEKWKYVPLQDFTSSSNIDWDKSITEIDQQLYKKYSLSQEEIDFIESRVKEMT
jgi:hypothetical protein